MSAVASFPAVMSTVFDIGFSTIALHVIHQPNSSATGSVDVTDKQSAVSVHVRNIIHYVTVN